MLNRYDINFGTPSSWTPWIAAKSSDAIIDWPVQDGPTQYIKQGAELQDMLS